MRLAEDLVLVLGAVMEEFLAGVMDFGLVGVLGGSGDEQVRFEMVSVRKRDMRESASGVSILGTVVGVESVCWVEAGVRMSSAEMTFISSSLDGGSRTP